MVSEAEFKLRVANLSTKALLDQKLEIGLVIHSEDLG